MAEFIDNENRANRRTMDICEQIRSLLTQRFLFGDDRFPWDDDASLLDAGVIDSTGILELTMLVEETFGIQVRDEEIVPENFDTVRCMAAYVTAKRAAACCPHQDGVSRG
jgi:acyl carrier protein